MKKLCTNKAIAVFCSSLLFFSFFSIFSFQRTNQAPFLHLKQQVAYAMALEGTNADKNTNYFERLDEQKELAENAAKEEKLRAIAARQEEIIIEKAEQAEIARLEAEAQEQARIEMERIEAERLAEEARILLEQEQAVLAAEEQARATASQVVVASTGESSAGSFSVTYYSAYDGTQIGITAGGTSMAGGNIYTSDGYRIIAADRSVLPLGTIVRITTASGESFLAKVDDTGGAIVGNRIDIAVSSASEAYALGRTTATITILN